MTGYILRRLVLLFPVLIIVGVVVFALVHVTPGDPAMVILGPDATPEQVANLRRTLGLDAPVHVQFVRWFGNIVRLNFGESLFLRQPVVEALLDRAQPTALLTIYSLIIAILLGIPAGVLAAMHRNSLVDRVLMALSISGSAIPSFVLGILLILLFAVTLRWFPAGGFVEITRDPIEHSRMMIMPSLALGFSEAALLARVVRSSMLDVLREDYIRTAASKGLTYRRVVIRHALRNALIPAITVIGSGIGALLGGAVVTETVFRIPGMGQLVVQSVLRRDFPVIQGAVMAIAAIYLLTNLLVDVLYVYVDPRIRYGRK